MLFRNTSILVGKCLRWLTTEYDKYYGTYNRYKTDKPPPSALAGVVKPTEEHTQ